MYRARACKAEYWVDPIKHEYRFNKEEEMRLCQLTKPNIKYVRLVAVPLARGMQLLVSKFSFIIQRGLLAFEPQKEMNPELFHIAIFFFLSVSSQVLVNLQKERIIMKMY